MDSMEVNKTLAAVLVAGIAFMVTGLIADGLVHPVELKKTAIAISGVPAAGGAAPKLAPIPTTLPLLAKADVKKGEAFVGQVCAACHTYKAGAPNGVGPNLYNVVDRPQGSEPGFSYSSAFKGKLHGKWTYNQLNAWLYDPQRHVPGTRMSYTGIRNTQQRADVIAFLRTLAPKPAPLPTAAQIQKAAAAVKAAAAKAPAPAKQANAAPQIPHITPLLAKADVKKGEAFVGQVCAACHTTAKGAPNGVGPNLFDVVGRKQGTEAGFSYSSAFKAKMHGTWTFTELNHWLYDPQKLVPGTHMSYTGIKNTQQRADVVAYLRTLSDHVVALPTAAPAAGKPAAAKPVPAQPATAAPATAKPAAITPPATTPMTTNSGAATPPPAAQPPATQPPAK